MCVITGISAILGAALFSVGSTAVTVGGALAATAVVACAAVAGTTIYKSARASAKAQKAQAEALKALEENTGTTGVSKTTSSLAENTSKKRTLSSLRISLLPQAADDEDDTSSLYDVDSNTTVSSTANMAGLNIATA